VIYQLLLGIVTIFSAISTFWLVYSSQKSVSLYNVLMSIIIAVSNIGFFLMSIATTLEGAIFANAFSYMGALYLPLIVMVSLAKMSDSKIPSWFIGFISAANLVVHATIVLATKYPFYYSKVLLKPGPIGDLITVSGACYAVRIVILAVEIVLSLFFVVLTVIGKKTASRRTMWLYLIVTVSGILVYISEKLLPMIYDHMPFVYFVCSILLVVGNAQLNLYDVSSHIESKIADNSGLGYITFDRKFNYVGANKNAMKFFPEISKVRIDTQIVADDYVLRDLLRWVKKNAESNLKDVETVHTDVYLNTAGAKKHLQCELSFIRFGMKKKVMGYILELQDDTAQNNYIHELNYQGIRFKQEADRQTKRNKNLQNSTILGMASMIESRDNSTGGHINRTSSCVTLFCDELKKRELYKVSDTFWENTANAAPLHDLGKIAVDDYILRKPASFTDEEYKKMKTHAAEGAKIVNQVLKGVDDREFIKIAENVAHYHHEKYDGSGYPRHLKGENIPLEARIMALADVFDALASKRYYKEPMSYDEAFKIIRESSGTHFDPQLTKVFLDISDKIVELYESFEGTEYHR